MTSAESSNSASTTGETGPHPVFKRKHPNTPFPSNTRAAQTFMDHPLQTNTKEFFHVGLPFFPQYNYYHSNPNNEQPNYVNENALFPTLSWTYTIISVNHYHSHYITIQMTMNYVKTGYIISLQHFTRNSSQPSD